MRGDEYCIEYLLDRLVPCLGLGQDLTDEVDWSLDWVCVAFFLLLDDDGSTDHMSSRSEVEQ
jgi:hypothetical protein